MKSSITVLKEQLQHFALIKRLSKYEIKSKNQNNYLGSLWEFINPLIQIAIYWFVFANIRERSNVTLSNGEDVSFALWLIVGFVVWIFFMKAAIDGSKSVYSRLTMLSKMNFPMSVVPNIPIFSYLFVHFILLGLTIVVLNVSGVYATIHYIELIYLIFSMVVFLFGFSLITSTLSTIIRDIHQLLSAVLKMLLYLSPVLWEIGKIAEPYGTLAKLNPLYYLIEGYRAALFGTEWYAIENLQYTMYFWVVTILLLIIGSAIHVKFRRHFVDFL